MAQVVVFNAKVKKKQTLYSRDDGLRIGLWVSKSLGPMSILWSFGFGTNIVSMSIGKTSMYLEHNLNLNKTK